MNYHQQSGVTGPLVTESLKSPACNSRMGAMPGDPKEARAHAANCVQLAETASSPTLQQTFADLAKQWNRRANELDDAYALLKALNELDLREATTSDGNLSFLEKANASQQAPRIRLP